MLVIEWVDERALSALLDRVSWEDLQIKIEEVRAEVTSVQAARELPETLSLDGTMIEILAPGGAVMGRSRNLQGDDLPIPRRNGDKLNLVGQRIAGPVMVATTGLSIPEHPGYSARIAIPLDEFRAAKARKRISGALSFLVGLVLTGVVGYLLSGFALRPVERVRRNVEGIEAEGMSMRIDTSQLPDDEIGKLAATFNDLLDRVAAAREKQQRFVEDASHDLRSPLTAIAGHAQLLLRRGKQDPALWERPLKAILKESDRLRRLVDDLLILAQPGGTGGPVETIDAGAVVAETVQDRAVLHPQVRLGPVAPLAVRIPADHLRRILSNLLDNALRAVDGQGEIRVSLLERAGKAHLVVADTGVGIPIQEQARVFDRFYRLDRARGKGQGGSGLGLAIVQALAEQWGGAARLESQEGVGTTVTVELPVQRPEAPASVGGPERDWPW